MVEKQMHIMVVEDNPKYTEAAKKAFSNYKGMIYANDYRTASMQLPPNSKFRPDGVIIDCFFPFITGSNLLDEGYKALEELRKLDNKQKGPVSKALTALTQACGEDYAKLIAGNEKIDYDRTVDMYTLFDNAMKRSAANQPLGILLADKLEKEGIPFVLATSTFHHDALTQPIQDYAGKRGWTLIDCPQGKEDYKATEEFWLKVYDQLYRKIQEG